jgi:hypothetical protein
MLKIVDSRTMSCFISLNLPTYAKKTQYMPANTGNGMDANRAPNFPRTAKKIMNPADICTTLLLPTCVTASKPIFSTETEVPLAVPKNESSKIPIP